ncbi:patatin-like phospholipase family protein [Aestuariicella sp. G3-2]|uniref:patatin-like phospholipase family protein n=1 Tax=Pseudomaricurvus albidus TaxID=2842452 RepID=UPI001C0CF2B9|nr:patatin-like phospholipase family protein [Aestuariicella albida]
MTNALILSGGGARAAYQVGVLSAVNELLPATTRNPFPIICGTSAGAINALALASHSGSFYEAVADLNHIWADLRTDKVFKTSWRALLGGAMRLFFSLFNEGVSKKQSLALLDNEPLREFLAEYIDFDQLEMGLKRGDLKAICTTAMNYSTGESVSFFQGDKTVESWRRYRRIGVSAKLTLDHLMASAAIPALFPAVKVNEDYYGDGALRQVAPISPALHMGADRIFVIGVSNNRDPLSRSQYSRRLKYSPSIGQVFGQLFNSAFIDSLEGDLEHLERVNSLLNLIPDEVLQENKTRLRPVETMVISPSKALDKLAGRKIRHMPRSVRMFLRSTGATNKAGGAATTSYLLFEKPYLDELMELGYQDAMWEKDNIQEFFKV